MNRRHFITSISALASCIVAGGASAAAFPFSVKESETQLIASGGGWLTRAEARSIGPGTLGRTGTVEVTINADCATLTQQLAELGARLKALDPAESLFCGIREEIEECLAGRSDELICLEGGIAAGTNEILVKVKLGPVLENHLTTLRAVQGNSFGHGDLRV